jgi:hypothetical protein
MEGYPEVPFEILAPRAHAARGQQQQQQQQKQHQRYDFIMHAQLR